MTFEEQYRQIAPRLTNWLIANGAGYALACDVVQEAFLRLWKMKDELSDDPMQVSGLIWTIAKNYWKDVIRKNNREVLQDEIRDEDVNEAAITQDATRGQDVNYIRQRVQEALAKLPPLLREAYTLFQIQELSIREIARRTNAAESLVKVRIFRAKQKLQPLLKDLL